MNLIKNKQYLLKKFANFIQPNLQHSLDNIFFVCVQHLLPSTVDLFAELINLGARPENIFLLGKHYSTVQSSADKLKKLGIYLQKRTVEHEIGLFREAFELDICTMWDYVSTSISNNKPSLIIIIDDGARCLAQIPSHILDNYPIVGIEQTSGGLLHSKFQSLNYPIIEVATSASKKVLESPFIAEAIAKQAFLYLQQINTDNKIFGVVGAGAIGSAVIEQLTECNCEVISYDINKNTSNTDSHNFKLESLLRRSDIIFGCTGTDIFQEIDINQVLKGEKTLISCSSEDREFLSLLKLVQENNLSHQYNKPTDNIFFKINQYSRMKILRGGFPINFHPDNEIEAYEDISLTRTLMLGAIIQAIDVGHNEKRREKGKKLMLNSNIQKYIALNWLKNKAELNRYVPNFNNNSWIIKHSGGVIYELNNENTLNVSRIKELA